jgi:sphingolipid delta-4 desaturase
MLARYPEIKNLYGPCRKTKYVCTALVMAQLGLCFLMKDASWWLLLLSAYAVGGVINQSLLLAIHELSHNLAFDRPLHNRLFSLFINLPVGLPVAAAFREYHLMHHTQQGVDGIDTDIPTVWETKVVRGPMMKFIWLSLQGLAYGLRPLFMLPLRPTRWVILNAVVQIAFDLIIFHFWGLKALLYLPISTLLVMGLHPISGHYISEHYVIREGQETYSYYGPLNKLAFNVGYHNEHHDFPYIPGSRLPELRKIAPEFYESLAKHTSWTKILWDYVARADLKPTSRVKRTRQSAESTAS